MSLKEYPGSAKTQDCYRIEHGGSATLWVSTAERDWIFNYAHLLHIEWEPSNALMIFFSTHQVRIVGQNLRRLVEALSNLSLAQITFRFDGNNEMDEAHLLIQKVEIICVEEHQ